MKLKIIDTDITSNEHWKKSITYIITAKIQVLNNVCLKIDNDTNILLLNNSISAIIFNQGSQLYAKKINSFAIASYDITYNKYILDTTQLNGGWTFLGNNKSKFKINELNGSFLGSPQISSITIKDTNNNILKIKKIKLNNCKNNINLINSFIKIKKIKIYNGNAGFILNNSILNIKNNFNVSLITSSNFVNFSNKSNILINKHACFSLVSMYKEPNQYSKNIVFISKDERVSDAIPPYNFTNINKLKALLNITKNDIS